VPLRQPRARARGGAAEASLETAYCAEVLAATYQAMGLLSARRRPNWYDAGRFWSGDDLRLSGGYRLSGEVAITVGEAPTATPGIAQKGRGVPPPPGP
jgi:hypothetical protein